MEVVFELFCQGVSYYGSYWDHVLGYWKASLEQPERVFSLKYGDMNRETTVFVKRLAEFIGHPFSAEEERAGVVEGVMDVCSFEKLSNLEANKKGMHREDTPVAIENNTYFRRGKVGDWKNHLTAEMVQRMDLGMATGRIGDGFDHPRLQSSNPIAASVPAPFPERGITSTLHPRP